MLTLKTIILILVCFLGWIYPLYGQQQGENKAKDNQVSSSIEEKTTSSKETKGNAFIDFINRKVYASTVEKKDEKTTLRKQWEELLKVDIFYPYFKAKEVEDWVSEKGSIKIKKLKGKPKFDNNQIQYIFKLKF